MATLPGPNNAISYAQFRLQGGWKGTALIAGICVAVLGGLLALQLAAAMTDGRSTARVFADWPQGLVLLQVAVVMVVGPLQVTAAVRQDVNRRMVESHRLMPITPAGVVAGYVTGGPWATLVLAGTVFTIGAFCCVMGGVDPFAYLRANVVLAVVGACLWTAAVHLSMVSRLGILLLLVLVPMMMMVDGGPAELIPGFGMLTAPLVSASALILGGRGRVHFSPDAAVMAMVAQVAVGLICFRAAARAYRLPGTPGLSPALGLLLLATWVAVSVAGLTMSDTFGLRVRMMVSNGFGPRVTSSITVAMLVAAMPVAAAVRAACRGTGTGGTGGDADNAGDRPAIRRAAAVTITAILFVVAVPAVALMVWPDHQRDRLPLPGLRQAAMLVTILVVALSLGGLACVFAVAYQRLERAWVVALVWVLATWALPVVIDSVIVATTNRGESGWTMGGSPIGALSMVWADGEPPPVGGMLYQALVTGACAAAATTVWARRRRRAAVVPASGPTVPLSGGPEGRAGDAG